MMRHVNYRDVAKFIPSIAKSRHVAAVRAIRSTMQTRARVIVREEINATRPNIPVDRGDYLRSWRAENVEDGAKVFSTSPYASVVDGGRRPGTMPNVQALIGWAHRHGMEPAKNAAWAIAISIKKRGIAAKNVFARACVRIVAECEQAARLASAAAGSDDGVTR